MIVPLRRCVVANLDVASLPAGEAEGPGRLLACMQCGSGLDLHQPDPGDPERILGTCTGCGHWHMISLDRKLGMTSVKLPLVGPIRDSWGLRDGHG